MLSGFLPLVVHGRRDLWADEALSAYLATLPAVDLMEVLWQQELNGALHSLLLWALRLGSAPEWLLRLPSALAICVSSYLLMRLVSRLVSPSWALPAGVAFVALPGVLESATTARSNALAILAVVALMSLVERLTSRRALAYGVVAGLGLYLHFFVALVVVGHACFLAVTRAPESRRPALLLPAALPLCLASLPLAFFLLGAGTGHVSWIPETTPDRALAYVARAVVGMHGKAGEHDLAVLVALLAPSAAGCLLLLLRRALSGRPRTGSAGRGAGLGLSTAGAVVVLAFAVSQVKPLFVPRYLWIALPGVLLVLIAGLAVLPPVCRALGLLGSGALLALSACGTSPSSEAWESAATAVQQEAAPGDVVDSYWAFLRPALAYYAPASPTAADAQWIPSTPPSRAQFFASSAPTDTSPCRTPPEAGALWLVVVDGREEGPVTSCTGRPVERRSGVGWHALVLR